MQFIVFLLSNILNQIFRNFHNCGKSGHTNQSKYPIKRYWCVQDWQARLPVEDPHIRQFQLPLIKGCIEHIRWWFWYPFNIYFYFRILNCLACFPMFLTLLFPLKLAWKKRYVFTKSSRDFQNKHEINFFTISILLQMQVQFFWS